MHKCIMLIVQAEDAADAKYEVDEFLEQYGDGDVWDWYVIGGRWSGTLNALYDKFRTAANKFIAKKYEVKVKELMLTQNRLEQCADDLKAIWEKLGGTGKNPYARDPYVDRTGADDILPLSECAPIVKKWKRNMLKEANKAFREMCIERRKEQQARKEGKVYVGGMSGYYAGVYKDAILDNFCFDSNTYDINRCTNNPDMALGNPEGHYVVIVDLHN